MEKYGATKWQRDRQRQTYINSIKTTDVCKLASSHNTGRPCHEFRNPEHGSFNVCFFVRFPFDDKRWVVRFPIKPALYDAWEKLQSEIATMEYIANNTTIPIPRVHAYGPGGESDGDNPTGLPYIILEYAPGRPLDAKGLVKAPQETSARFYSQLAEILSQLRMQEFDHVGSPMPGPGGSVSLTSPLSVDLNALQLCSMQRVAGKQSSAIDFAFCRYQILLERLDQPISEMDEDDARHEVFALEDFKRRLFSFINPLSNHGPFVLSHGDLRPSNIIVGEDLTIIAIIDWEWSCVVPRQFFIPPTWFAGHDIPDLSDQDYRIEYDKFYDGLRRAGSAECRKLAAEWGPDLSTSANLFLPAALLHHQNFTLIYYSFLFPKFYKGIGRRDMLRRFYERDGQGGIFNNVVRRKLEASERYTKYLKDNGLLNNDEQHENIVLQQLQEIGERAEQMLAVLKRTTHLAT